MKTTGIVWERDYSLHLSMIQPFEYTANPDSHEIPCLVNIDQHTTHTIEEGGDHEGGAAVGQASSENLDDPWLRRGG